MDLLSLKKNQTNKKLWVFLHFSVSFPCFCTYTGKEQYIEIIVSFFTNGGFLTSKVPKLLRAQSLFCSEPFHRCRGLYGAVSKPEAWSLHWWKVCRLQLLIFFFPPRDLKFTKYRWFFTGIAKNTSLISITLLPNFQACSRAWSHFYISINSNNNSSSSSRSKSNIIKAAYLFAYSLSPKWLKFFCWNFPIKDQSEGDVSI